MPNSFAYLMLLIWPVVMIILFRKLRVERALIWSLLGAYLFLPPAPAGFDFPLLPPFTKDSMPNLVAFGICLALFGWKELKFPKSKISRILIALFVFGPVITVFTNGEPINFNNADALPGLRLSDAIALSINQLSYLFSFLLAQRFLGTPEAHRDLLVALFIAGLVYSIPMLIEVRLSPQLNLWFYGYYQHYFGQSIRFGGYRPVVFMNHGLWVAFFSMTAVVATIALWRAELDQKRSTLYLFLAGYLGVVLVLCKSTGALLFALFLAPMIVVTNRRFQINLSVVLVLFVLAYPALKSVDLIPTETMVAQAEKISHERAGSLQFRFDNEDILFERANEKSLFGWGSWGRNHIHDPNNGEILTVSDGRWIIVFGVFGWVGFIAEFGLLGLPLILLWARKSAQVNEYFSPFIGPLALILAINIVDLLLNATLTPITWIISGALLGCTERTEKKVPITKQETKRWRPIL